MFMELENMCLILQQMALDVHPLAVQCELFFHSLQVTLTKNDQNTMLFLRQTITTEAEN